MASITADGPFSVFPGVDRIAVLLDGEVCLESEDVVLRWSIEGEAHSFPGEAAFSARVDGSPARFLNVMTRRVQCLASVAHYKASALLPPSEATVCFFVSSGQFRVEMQSEASLVNAGQGLLSDDLRSGAAISLMSDAGCLIFIVLSSQS